MATNRSPPRRGRMVPAVAVCSLALVCLLPSGGSASSLHHALERRSAGPSFKTMASSAAAKGMHGGVVVEEEAGTRKADAMVAALMEEVAGRAGLSPRLPLGLFENLPTPPLHTGCASPPSLRHCSVLGAGWISVGISKPCFLQRAEI